MTEAIIFDIQKFSIHDGPGIRTNVFLKGCPLRCRWCHNPESWETHPVLLYDGSKCIGCRACEMLCPNKCHSFTEQAHLLDRSRCVGCGACTEHCYTGALELCGKARTVEEVMKEVMKDKPFYDNSGGGITLSGGEPMMHADFSLALLQAAKSAGLHTCMETCGFAPWEQFERIRPYVDMFLYDVKSVNAERHREYTGQDNALILENLRRLDAAGEHFRLRCPLIPGLNDSDEDLAAIAELADSLQHAEGIDVEPYHPLGVSKAQRMGVPEGYSAPFTPEETWKRWVAFLSERTRVPVRKQ